MAELYSSCILKGLSECGSYLPKREISLVKFHSLNDDVLADVAYFKIGGTQPYIGSNNILLEKGLTANRAKIQESRCKADSDICQNTDIVWGSITAHLGRAFIQTMHS